MLQPETLTSALGLVIAGTPIALLIVLGVCSLVNRPLPERLTSQLVAVAMCIGLTASLAVLTLMLSLDVTQLTVKLGNWIIIPHYHFSFKLLFDRLSVPFVILTFVLSGTIGAFATRYLHREPGYHRFFFLFAMFVVGMVVSALAGTIETLFTGWELVGLSSALLVAFFQERAMPVRNGLRVWSVYRVADAAFLIAAVALHHDPHGEGDFGQLLGGGQWPYGRAALPPNVALLVGLLLLVAAAGKSGLVPFSGWLPRAMEGPTPSSAVFYGALSVHLGAYLLLRMSPIIADSILLAIIIVALGLLTAVYATLTGYAQTDIKSALCFASLAQVGIIVAEIGMGWHYVALVHMLGHASLRTLQFLRAPSLLADYRNLENAIGTRLPRWSGALVGFMPERGQRWFYRFALERGYLDACLNDYVTRPFQRLFQQCDKLERQWTTYLSGGESSVTDTMLLTTGSLEDLA